MAPSRFRASTSALLAAVCLLAAACGPDQRNPITTAGQPTRSLEPSPIRSPIDLGPVVAVEPALKATIPGGISKEITEYVRQTPGVAAAARVTLANVAVESTSTGKSEVSLAAVDPAEFRPLAPDVTAQAKFVWEGLAEGQFFLAHEEQDRLGIQAGSALLASGPGGRSAVRVGGIAANGVPNLAGALTSVARGHLLGLGDPTMLLVGLQQGAKPEQVIKDLGKLLVGVPFSSIKPPSGKAFLAGKAATQAIGTFRYTTNADGTITQDPAWVQNFIVSKRVPIFTGAVKCHKVMIPQLTAALKEIEDAGLAHLIDPKQYGGCYVPRHIGRDVKRPLSMHAWGLAIDFNTIDNPEGHTPKMDPRVVQTFERWGFRWGGRWSIPDGHHFELAAIVKS